MNEEYIYAVEHPDGFYKVGRSKNPYDRVSQIGVGSPYDLEFRFAMSYYTCSFQKNAEMIVQERLSKYRFSGEWYDVEKSTLLRILHSVMNDEDVEGMRIYDVRKRKRRERKRERGRHRADRLSRRPDL